MSNYSLSAASDEIPVANFHYTWLYSLKELENVSYAYCVLVCIRV